MMLTQENYFSPENNMEFMGTSQFKDFRKCESAALARLNGTYGNESSVALLVGSYVDAHFEGTLDLFKAQHPELFTKNGLKSEYKKADYIINRIERDEMFMKYMDGEKQKILTGEINGVPCKIKIDSYFPGKCIVDLKVMRDFEKIWDGTQKASFVEFWGYDFQAAFYQTIEGNQLPFIIAGATKEVETDICLMGIPQERIGYCLELIKDDINRFADIKKGLIEPERCGVCDYCKSTKKLDKIISYEDL